MSARNGLSVRKVRRARKLWTEVLTRADGSLVAFEDIFDMVQFIIACEVDKYESNGRDAQEAWLRWGAMVQEVLVLSCRFGTGWDAIADRFGLPRRDGSRISPVRVFEERPTASLPWPTSNGRNADGTWGELGWFTEALYREWG